MRKSLVGLAEKQISVKVCEACDQNILSRISTGIEVDEYGYSTINLCKKCGSIDADLMQFCREVTLGCNDN